MKAVPRTILLAEDNSDDAFLTTRALQSAGITQTVEHCRDGQAVIEYLQRLAADPASFDEERMPALVLLDLKMPRVGGLETLKWIRQHALFHPLVVLALTSSSERRDVETAYQLKINAYLVKPSSLGEMVDVARAIRQFWLEENHFVRPHFSFSSNGGMAQL